MMFVAPLSIRGPIGREPSYSQVQRGVGTTIAKALSQLKTICEGLNNTNFEDERGRRKRRGLNKGKLELGTRYADVVVANQRSIPTKGVSRKVKAPPGVQCPTTAMAVFYSNLEMETEDPTGE
jgi:hypothetical protein